MGFQVAINKAYLNEELKGHVTYGRQLNSVSYIPPEKDGKAKIILEVDNVSLSTAMIGHSLFDEGEIKKNKKLSVRNKKIDYGGPTDIYLFKDWPTFRNEKLKGELRSELGSSILSVFRSMGKIDFHAALSSSMVHGEPRLIIPQRLQCSGTGDDHSKDVYPSAISVVQEDKPMVVIQYPDEQFPKPNAFSYLENFANSLDFLDEKPLEESREILIGFDKYKALVISKLRNEEFIENNEDHVNNVQIFRAEYE